MFVPLISLLALLHLNEKATKILRANGIKVGLMGVSSSELEKMQSRMSAYISSMIMYNKLRFPRLRRSHSQSACLSGDSA
jgi:hypothetical protein